MEQSIKLMLLGDGASGKTSWVHRLKTNEFLSAYIPTLGVEVSEYTYNSTRGEIIFKIWDMAGQERFGGLREGYFIGANAGIVFFDISSHHTHAGISNWKRDLIRTAGDIPLIVVANKTDMAHYNQYSETYIEMSLLNGTGIFDPLEAISKLLPSYYFSHLQNFSDFFKD